MKYILFILTICVACCKKAGNNDGSPADKARAALLHTQLSGHAIRLKLYYSDMPIDYYPTDTIGPTTNQWQFVSSWIKDDSITFGTDLAIHQNAIKIPTDNSDVIVRPWGTGADKQGVYVNFVSHQYLPLQYRLISFTDTALVMYVPRDNAKLISEFKVLN